LQKSKFRHTVSAAPAVLLVLGLAFIAVPTQALSGPETDGLVPGPEAILPEDEVKDRFFAYLIGLAEAEAYGRLSGDEISQALGGFSGATRVPFELISEIRRTRGEGAEPGVVSISFMKNLKTPVPYSILGYHPGSVVADTVVSFYEYYLPRKSVYVAENTRVTLTRVHVFATYEGWAVVDIDAWVDKLLGGRLDDTWLVVMALFKYEDDWHGIAAGYGPGGEGRSGVFNFRTNKILFPTPDQFRTLGPYLRNLVRKQKGIKAPLPSHGNWVEK
jgi:hypothetical protein